MTVRPALRFVALFSCRVRPQFGKVQKGLWRGTVVAVKTMILPANMTGQQKREKMAVMEAAISSSLVHPNIGELHVVLKVSPPHPIVSAPYQIVLVLRPRSDHLHLLHPPIPRANTRGCAEHARTRVSTSLKLRILARAWEVTACGPFFYV